MTLAVLPRDPVLSVVVPAYNEAATIEAVLQRLAEVPLKLEVIAVNDASTDDNETLWNFLCARCFPARPW